MDPSLFQLNASELKLLAINALFEQARSGSPSAESCCQALLDLIQLGERLEREPQSVRVEELDDVQASILIRSSLS